MEIILNNQKKSLRDLDLSGNEITVFDLSFRMTEHPSRLAILVNNHFVQREKWKEIVLKEGDKIETVSLIAGG